MVRRTKPRHISQPAQEPAFSHATQPLYGGTQAQIIEEPGEGRAYNMRFCAIGAGR